MLAAALMRAQGVDVRALFFESPFFNSDRAKESSQWMGIPLQKVDIGQAHLEVVLAPRFGYGTGMNPCIDCHILMFRLAGQFLRQERADFLVSGEVLGQRPMSQNRQSLLLIARESGFEELILRPLSAKHLPPTLPEEKGWIDRDRLLGLKGRSRTPQMETAAELGITRYPSPAGGCLLTDKSFSNRLRDLVSSRRNPDIREIELLKVGRHFRISPHAKVLVGRNKAENELIRRLASREDVLLRPLVLRGPTVLLVGSDSAVALDRATSLAAAYSDTVVGQSVTIQLTRDGKSEYREVETMDKAIFRPYLI